MRSEYQGPGTLARGEIMALYVLIDSHKTQAASPRVESGSMAIRFCLEWEVLDSSVIA